MQQRQRLLESIAAGLADAENGRMLTTVELRERLRAWRSDRVDPSAAARLVDKLIDRGEAFEGHRLLRADELMSED